MAFARRLSGGPVAAQLPLPGIERALRNAFLAAERSDRQMACTLPLDPLPPLVPKRLIPFPSHDWVASKFEGGKKRTTHQTTLAVNNAYLVRLRCSWLPTRFCGFLEI